MKSHLEITDREFEQKFQHGTLNPLLFTHEAHLRLAWIHIKKYGVEQAIENICTQLTRFVELAGARDKFNKTLTIAAIKAVNHFINKSTDTSFKEFIERFPGLKFNFKELMSFHYRRDIYNSALAKKQYLEPDLLEFT